MSGRGRARIAVWEGGSLWLLETGQGFGETGFHAHHAVQVTIALGGRFTLATEEETVSAPVAAVAPDAPHRFESDGLIGFLFVEPESRAGRQIAARLLGGREIVAVEMPLPDNELAQLRSALDDGSGDALLADAGRALIEALAGEAGPVRLPDARVRGVIEAAAARLDEPLRLPEAAAAAGLSPGRLRHLFAEETGLPFKSYLLWLRLAKAVGAYGAGANLTEAAHEAGFADSAHFSRTFRRTFGAPATALKRTSPYVQSRPANRA
ncbi:MAG: helix-turn-helix transcriptional regulator [Alphaproteobacteria bacterium]|nr:MAG: helix-turn-helix transcriptional regulator [Alphaproteobacteria bacterium]